MTDAEVAEKKMSDQTFTRVYVAVVVLILAAVVLVAVLKGAGVLLGAAPGLVFMAVMGFIAVRSR